MWSGRIALPGFLIYSRRGALLYCHAIPLADLLAPAAVRVDEPVVAGDAISVLVDIVCPGLWSLTRHCWLGLGNGRLTSQCAAKSEDQPAPQHDLARRQHHPSLLAMADYVCHVGCIGSY